MINDNTDIDNNTDNNNNNHNNDNNNLEPKWSLFLKVNPQNKAFSNQNKALLGSRNNK